MSRNLILTTAFMALTSAALLFAQNADAPKKTTEAGAPAAWHSNLKSPEHMFATCVALANQEEVAISEFARQKTKNEDVKAFASMLLTEHHDFLLKLQKFAPEATQAGFLDISPKTAAAEAKSDESKIQLTAAEAEEAAKPGSRREFNHLQFEREMAAQCLADAKEKLSKKSGAEFDKCFIGIQLAMHSGMRTKLIVMQRYASGEFASLLAEGQKATERHLAKAEELIKDLDHGSPGSKAEIRKERRESKGKDAVEK